MNDPQIRYKWNRSKELAKHPLASVNITLLLDITSAAEIIFPPSDNLHPQLKPIGDIRTNLLLRSTPYFTSAT